jgi:alkylhydroperoxidase family enzyme
MAVTSPSDIAWSDPILPVVDDPAWEAEVKRTMGSMPDFMRRVAPSPWMRRLCMNTARYRYTHLSARYANICFLVTSQENSCRYCYGAARAMLRLLGYSDKLITRIEREAQLAELDERERAFIEFSRNLARSSPRPGRVAREQLITLGFAPEVVAEMAFMIALNCLGNRITTLMACAPEASLEKLSVSWLGRVLRPFIARQMRKLPPAWTPQASDGKRTLSPLASILSAVPTAAALLQESLDDAFASPVIPRATKALMFAVVARSLECPFCEHQMIEVLRSVGFTPAEVDAALTTLSSPRLDAEGQALIDWVRDTVRYQPIEIQRRTRALLQQVGPEKTLEAVGIAALANGMVRLAMLHT